MTTFTLATPPHHFYLREVNNDDVFTSLTGAVQVQSRSGARWALTLNWRKAGAELRVLRGKLGQLNGMRHRLWIPLTALQYVRGGAGGTVVAVNGAHIAGATTIALKSLPSSTANLLRPGDFLQVGSFGQLVQATSTLTSSGTTGSLNIWPPLQRNRPDSDPVNIDQPGGLFIKTSDYGVGSGKMTSDWYCEIEAEFIQDVLA